MEMETGLVMLVVLNFVVTIILVMILDARLQKMETRWRNRYRLAEIRNQAN